MSVSSDSDDEEFLRPNGFEDVAVDNVMFQLPRHSSGLDDFSSPQEIVSPGKRKRGWAGSPQKKRKKGSSPNYLDVSDNVSADDEEDGNLSNQQEQDQSQLLQTSETEAVVDLDAISTPSPTAPDESYRFGDSISLSDDEMVVMPLPSEDLNPIVTVRVIWKTDAVQEFKIRKFQKVKEIYAHYAELEGVPEERILFTLREKEISSNDTPESLKIGLSFLEGGIIDANQTETAVPHQHPSADPSMLEIKVQQRGVREKHSVYIDRTDNMQVVVSKLAEDLNVAPSSIKLHFDGEVLDLSETPESLDLEGGECMDLVIRE